jgi:hypothetical protein
MPNKRCTDLPSGLDVEESNLTCGAISGSPPRRLAATRGDDLAVGAQSHAVKLRPFIIDRVLFESSCADVPYLDLNSFAAAATIGLGTGAGEERFRVIAKHQACWRPRISCT